MRAAAVESQRSIKSSTQSAERRERARFTRKSSVSGSLNVEHFGVQILGALDLDEHPEPLLLRIAVFLRLDEPQETSKANGNGRLSGSHHDFDYRAIIRRDSKAPATARKIRRNVSSGGREAGGSKPHTLNFTIFCCCSPSPWTPSRTTSPARKNFGSGLMPMPTPGGVPVMITSPGSMTKNCEQYQTR